MALTDTSIKRLKPRADRYLVGDGQGLSLEILPSGSRSWRYRYRFNGKLEKVSLGQYPAFSLQAARKKRDEYAEMLAHGKSPARHKQAEKFAVAHTTTVFEFGERYFKEIIERDCKDSRPMRRYLDKEIYPRLADKAVRDVTPADVQAIVFRKRDGGAPSVAAQIRNLLKRMFEYAMANGLITVNPALSIPMRFITQARPRTRALSPEEIRIYLQTLYQSNIRRQFKLALHQILLTLVRKSELIFARWEHIDFDTGEWQIPAENSKTKAPHTIYLSRQSLQIFRELQNLAGGSPWVIPSRSSLAKPFSTTALNQALQGVSFGIKPFTIHDMRRTSSTLLHEKGYPSDVIEKALNHTIGGVRGVYNRAAYADQRKKMLQFWADYIDSLASERKVLIGNFGRVS
jgi:site-specific recombinase XerD